MTEDDLVHVRKHIEAIRDRALAGDEFCIKTLGVLVLLTCPDDPDDEPDEEDDPGEDDEEVDAISNVVQFKRAA